MIDTRHLPFEFITVRYAIQTGSGRIRNEYSTGRCADLVSHNIQPVLLPGKAHDSLDEIGATCRVHPAGAENQVPATAFLQCYFSLQLGTAVGVERIGLVGFGIQARLLAVKDIIRGIVKQPYIAALCLIRQ